MQMFLIFILGIALTIGVQSTGMFDQIDDARSALAGTCFADINQVDDTTQVTFYTPFVPPFSTPNKTLIVAGTTPSDVSVE